jgi:hypothetical protein
MTENFLELNLPTPATRAEIRNFVISSFIAEAPGTGTGDLRSIYNYYVESLSDGNRIYLRRPAPLNKGVDFEVHVENTNFGISRRTTRPSHDSILADLRNKYDENHSEYENVRILIERLYLCEPINNEEYLALHFNSGHPIELILKSIKWLFIEQDVTYWNWSGRAMLYSGLIAI